MPASMWTLTVDLDDLDGTPRNLSYIAVLASTTIRSTANNAVFDKYSRFDLTDGTATIQLPAHDPTNLPYVADVPNWFQVQVGREKYNVVAQTAGSTHSLREFITSTGTPLTPSEYAELTASLVGEAALRASGDATSVATAAADATSKANAAQTAAAADATTKANAAQAAAIAAAATDATSKVATETTRAQAAETALQNGTNSALEARLDVKYAATADAAVRPFVQGAKGDYTGRLGTAGTGTDNRAAIQAALDAASNLAANTARLDYLTRKSVTVTLPPGHYYISAPSDGSPSLIVRPGVTFDYSGATLYADYPSVATQQWAAIKMEQYSSIRAGHLMPKAGSTPPDSAVIYDGIRMVGTDNHSRIVGYAANSEVYGFTQGAGIRTIGAWISFIKGMRITGNGYAIIHSHFGDAFTSYTVPGSTPVNSRVATDLFVDDCICVNSRYGGVVAGTSGDAANPNSLSYDTIGGIVKLGNCTLENIGGYPLQVVGGQALSVRDTHIEESGRDAGHVVYVDTVRVVSFSNISFNYGGRSIVRYDGVFAATVPSNLFYIAGSMVYELSGAYIHNEVNSSMTWWNTEPAVWSVRGVYTDSYALPVGVIDSTGKPSRKRQVATKTSNYALAYADEFVVMNGSSLTLTLLDPTKVNPGRVYRVKNVHASSLTVSSAASGTVDGDTSITLGQWASARLVSDGTQWLTA